MHSRSLLSVLLHCFALSLLVLNVVEPVAAKVENRTIDDNLTVDQPTHKAPVYQPTDKWNFGPSCGGCAIHLQPQFTYDNTWHDTTVKTAEDFYTMALTFTGTALYVYAIVPNTVPGAATHVNLTFTMDGKPVGPPYYHAPSASTDIEYNVSVYSVTGLENKQHTFVLTPTRGEEQSLMMFDYAVYTYDDGADSTASSSASSATSSSTSPPNDKKSSNVGAIVGGVVAGVAALVAGALLAFCLRRRRSKVTEAHTNEKALVLDPESWRSSSLAPITSGSPGPRHSAAQPETAVSPLSDVLGPGTSTAAIRQAALEHQLAEMQRQIDVLHSSGSRTHAPGSAEAESESAALRAQVNALRREVERLQVENAPPAYVGERPARSNDDLATQGGGAQHERSGGSAWGGPMPYNKRVGGT